MIALYHYELVTELASSLSYLVDSKGLLLVLEVGVEPTGEVNPAGF